MKNPAPAHADPWRAIWSKKVPSGDPGDLLASLIQADGFDSGFSAYTPAEWLLMVEDAADRTGVTDRCRVLEIGCGAGAFLHALHHLRGCTISGVDYSPSLLAAARRHLPQGEFACAEAIDMPFGSSTFDQVFSHGVFFYFPDHDYVESALREAHSKLKPGGHLCLMDLNDQRHAGAYLAERRKMFSTPEEYALKYAGLPHLFFDHLDLTATLEQAGFHSVTFFRHRVEAYGPARFRFNLTAVKN